MADRFTRFLTQSPTEELVALIEKLVAEIQRRGVSVSIVIGESDGTQV